MKKLLVTSLLVAALPAAALAQGTTLAGWTFSQFISEGSPVVSGETFENTNFIVATYRGNVNPNSNEVDGSIVGVNGVAGYTNPSIGSWSFANFNIDNALDVRADTFGALNTQNSTTLDGKQMHLTDTQGMMLSFNAKDTLWSISVADTAGYTNVDGAGNDFTFAARGNGGEATVEWLFNGTVFSTSVIATGGFATYGVDLPSAFYGNGVIEGRLTGSSLGTVSFDNAQIGGVSAVPEPSSFAALAGLAGLGFVVSRRRRA